MKRYYFEKNKVILAARALFDWQEEYRDEAYARYDSLEIAVQADGRFSVWGNLGEEDADLLRDTKPDARNLLAQVLGMADEISEE